MSNIHHSFLEKLIVLSIDAMIVKAAFPEAQVTVDSSCCAGVTKGSHQTALDAMKAVQIEIL